MAEASLAQSAMLPVDDAVAAGRPLQTAWSTAEVKDLVRHICLTVAKRWPEVQGERSHCRTPGRASSQSMPLARRCDGSPFRQRRHKDVWNFHGNASDAVGLDGRAGRWAADSGQDWAYRKVRHYDQTATGCGCTTADQGPGRAQRRLSDPTFDDLHDGGWFGAEVGVGEVNRWRRWWSTILGSRRRISEQMGPLAVRLLRFG